MDAWGGYMHYMMTGLEKLPDYRGECWRGYNHGTRAQILEQYQVGRPIQWGAFTSVTTDKSAAQSFAPDTRVIFKITVTSGRDINAYSFFPQEGEILLSPSHRFTVSSEPRVEAGYTIIDLVQWQGTLSYLERVTPRASQGRRPARSASGRRHTQKTRRAVAAMHSSVYFRASRVSRRTHTRHAYDPHSSYNLVI